MAADCLSVSSFKGEHGTVGSHTVALGNAAMMTERGLATAEANAKADTLRAEGKTAMFIAVDGLVAGIVAVADPIHVLKMQPTRRMPERGILRQPHRRPTQAGPVKLRLQPRPGHIHHLATRSLPTRAGRLNNLSAPRLVRLPNPIQPNFNPKDSPCERGASAEHVKVRSASTHIDGLYFRSVTDVILVTLQQARE